MRSTLRRLRSGRQWLGEARRKLRDLRTLEQDAFLGIYDFSYAPYALGDSQTFQEKVLVRAIETGYRAIRLCLVADPLRPGSSFQPHITAGNYATFLKRIYPSYLCTPMTEAVHVFRSRYAFNLFLLNAKARGVPTWPPLGDHFERHLDFISHAEINAFHARHGHLPRLVAPRGYEDSMEPFLQSAGRDRYVVAVNIRLSRMSARPADVHRDSPIEPWHRLFRHVAQRHPEVLFVFLGGFGEWDRAMLSHGNLVILRMLGYELPHELALLHKSDLFMGSSSGFAAAATFSETPYVIANMEHRFSAFNGVAVGTPRYPFGLPGQRISWEAETADGLISMFEEAFAGAGERRRRAMTAAAPAPEAGDDESGAETAARDAGLQRA